MTDQPDWMTVDEAKERFARIHAHRDDDETAHLMEDAFRSAVLREVVAGNPYSRDLAVIALDTDDLDFARWYA